MPQLDGRVFSRLAQFEALAPELKDEVSALETHLAAAQNEIFAPHHANLLKSIRSVRYKLLVEKVDAFLAAKDTPVTTTEDAPAPTEATTEAEAPAEAPASETPAEPAPAPTEEEAAKAKEEAAAKAKADADAAAAKAKADAEAKAARVAHAKELVDALVLKGFVTPYKEADKTVEGAESFSFGDRELFVPLAAAIAGQPTEQAAVKTVWDLVDGAIFATTLKRKAGFLAPLTAGKDAYVVVNATSKTLTVFESDLGRVPVLTIGSEGSNVSFDKTQFVHGVKVWNETITELLNAKDKLEREALVHALLAAGLTYHEDLAPGLEKVETIYELKDTDIDGQEVSFDKYKGKVLLIVNVSSKCGLTPTNYPELVSLHEKYGEQGFEVLGFPSNQFLGQEPGTNEEIKEFVKEYNVQFPLFAKGDVNGVDARPVFAFLKHKLPEKYIQWNFTKFLVDRNGVPSKRFGPRELPLSFEGEIVKLLAEEAKPEPVAETVTTETTTETITETVTETTTEGATETKTEVVTEVKAEVVTETTTETVTETVAATEVAVVAEPAPEVAPVETKVEPEKPAETAAVAAVEETTAAAVVVEETVTEVKVEETVTEVKTEEVKAEEVKVEAAAPAPAEEPTPAPKAEEPAQGFTPGNEPEKVNAP